jgi:hypothetical protein
MQCDHLLVIAGPTCAGKTTLIDRFRAGNLPSFSETLHIEHPSRWKAVTAIDMEIYSEPEVDHLILHYDIVYRLRSIRHYREDHALSVLVAAKKINLITLWATPEILISRLKSRRTQVIRESLISMRPFRIYGALHRWRNISSLLFKLNNTPEYIESVYDNWFDYCEEIETDSHWLINCLEKDPVLHPLSHRLQLSIKKL